MKNLNVIIILIDGGRLDYVLKSDFYKNLKSDDATFSVFAKNSFSNNFFKSVFGKSIQNIKF